MVHDYNQLFIVVLLFLLGISVVITLLSVIAKGSTRNVDIGLKQPVDEHKDNQKIDEH